MIHFAEIASVGEKIGEGAGVGAGGMGTMYLIKYLIDKWVTKTKNGNGNGNKRDEYTERLARIETNQNNCSKTCQGALHDMFSEMRDQGKESLENSTKVVVLLEGIHTELKRK